MALLIDTSVIVDVERGRDPSPALLEELGEGSAAVSSITASELLHGVHRADSASRHERRRAFVEAILAALPVLCFDLDVARVHARLWADLQEQGAGIGAHDLIIASTAIHHGLTLLTGNERHFNRVPDLLVRSWP